MKHKITLLLTLMTAGFMFLSGCASKQTASLPAITPTPTGQHQVGKFVWFDLLTEDVQAAQGFYKELFGWNIDTANGLNYRMVDTQSDGKGVPGGGSWMMPAR